MLKKFGTAVMLAVAVPLAACNTDAKGPAPGESADGSAAVDDKAGSTAKPGDRGPLARLLSKGPEFRDITVPAGTILPVELQTAIASDRNRIEDPVRARVRSPLVIDGVTAVPEGSAVIGSVTSVKRSGRVKGRAEIGFRLTSLEAHDERHGIRTSIVLRRAPATKTQDAVDIGIPAAAGAVAGAIVGGKDDAAKGAIIGGAAGTGYVLATRGKEVRLPSGTDLSVTLLEPVTVRVPLTR
jgi:hypothetical protein